jgi:hypothetical protein
LAINRPPGINTAHQLHGQGDRLRGRHWCDHAVIMAMNTSWLMCTESEDVVANFSARQQGPTVCSDEFA